VSYHHTPTTNPDCLIARPTWRISDRAPGRDGSAGEFSNLACSFRINNEPGNCRARQSSCARKCGRRCARLGEERYGTSPKHPFILLCARGTTSLAACRIAGLGRETVINYSDPTFISRETDAIGSFGATDPSFAELAETTSLVSWHVMRTHGGICDGSTGTEGDGADESASGYAGR